MKSHEPVDLCIYSSVVARRLQWDNLLWQVPALSLTAQSFLLTIRFTQGGAARAYSAILSFTVAVLTIHLMVKHRYGEIADSEWIEEYELRNFGYSLHGVSYVHHRKNKDPRVGPLAVLFMPPISSAEIWGVGLTVFPFAAILPLDWLYCYMVSITVYIAGRSVWIHRRRIREQGPAKEG